MVREDLEYEDRKLERAPRGSRKEARPSRDTRKRGGHPEEGKGMGSAGGSGRGKSERGFEKKDEGGRAWIAEITFATFATS